MCVCGNTGLSTLSPAGSGRGKDRGKSRKSIFGTAPARSSTTGEVTTQSRTPGKGTQGLVMVTVTMSVFVEKEDLSIYVFLALF